MNLYTSCSGSCITCNCKNFCLAGHGDDDYEVKSKEDLISDIKKYTLDLKIEKKLIDKDDIRISRLEQNIELCKKALKDFYNYTY